jgi:hypothetical protein
MLIALFVSALNSHSIESQKRESIDWTKLLTWFSLPKINLSRYFQDTEFESDQSEINQTRSKKDLNNPHGVMNKTIRHTSVA